MGASVATGKYFRVLIRLINPRQAQPGVIPVALLKSQEGANQRELMPATSMTGTALSSNVVGKVLSASLAEQTDVQGSENRI